MMVTGHDHDCAPPGLLGMKKARAPPFGAPSLIVDFPESVHPEGRPIVADAPVPLYEAPTMATSRFPAVNTVEVETTGLVVPEPPIC